MSIWNLSTPYFNIQEKFRTSVDENANLAVSFNPNHMLSMVKKMFKFDVIIHPQIEGGFSAEVPALPGCYSEGETLDEVEKNIEEAVELYLETLEEKKLPLPSKKPKKSFQIQVTVLKDLQHA